MKRKLFFLLSTMCYSFSFAAIITVSNNASSPGQYSNLQTAINSASVGDTLYIQGSTTSYGNITINKKLTLVGAGYSPDSTDYNISTQLGNLTFDTVINVPISGTKIIGMSLEQSYYSTGDRGFIQNITFEKCLFNSSVYVAGNNWIILNCIFNSVMLDLGYYSNAIVSNSFFVSSYIYYSNKNSVNIYNCIFLNYSSNVFYSVSYLGVYNSIFWNNSVSGCSNCLFVNNITYDDVARELPGTGNSGSGNINNTDPLFVSTLPAPTTTIPYASLKNYNWNLQTGSPGYKTGTDGSDIGFYGGAYPNKNLSGMYHQIPVVKNFLIKNPVVQKNGSLKVSITATKK